MGMIAASGFWLSRTSWGFSSKVGQHDSLGSTIVTGSCIKVIPPVWKAVGIKSQEVVSLGLEGGPIVQHVGNLAVSFPLSICRDFGSKGGDQIGRLLAGTVMYLMYPVPVLFSTRLQLSYT
jgi:hypothetical protein